MSHICVYVCGCMYVYMYVFYACLCVSCLFTGGYADWLWQRADFDALQTLTPFHVQTYYCSTNVRTCVYPYIGCGNELISMRFGPHVVSHLTYEHTSVRTRVHWVWHRVNFDALRAIISPDIQTHVRTCVHTYI